MDFNNKGEKMNKSLYVFYNVLHDTLIIRSELVSTYNTNFGFTEVFLGLL